MWGNAFQPGGGSRGWWHHAATTDVVATGASVYRENVPRRMRNGSHPANQRLNQMGLSFQDLESNEANFQRKLDNFDHTETSWMLHWLKIETLLWAYPVEDVFLKELIWQKMAIPSFGVVVGELRPHGPRCDSMTLMEYVRVLQDAFDAAGDQHRYPPYRRLSAAPPGGGNHFMA